MNKMFEIKRIIVLHPINFWGRLAIKIMHFAGWLYEATGNDWEKEKITQNKP